MDIGWHFIINKALYIVLRCESTPIKMMLMFIYSPDQVIGHTSVRTGSQ